MDENPCEDGHDHVTPFDQFLYGPLAQQPAAVDGAMVEEANEQRAIAKYEKYMGVSADDQAYGPDLTQWMAGWNAALAAQPGGSDNGQ